MGNLEQFKLMSAVSKRMGTLCERVLTLNNGLKIPQVGLGCYHIEGPDAKDAIYNALDIGYRHFDTASFYKNDSIIGKEVQNHMFMRSYARDEYFVCSKIPPAYQTYKRAVTMIKNSNKSVDLGYLDCMLLLWPGSFKAGKVGAIDDPINIENRHETWKALEEAVAEGTILSAGVSNFTAKHLEDLMKYSDLKPIMN